MKKITLLALLILTLSGSTPSYADKQPEGTKHWAKIALRSALIPGWGQWRSGNRWRGVGILGAFALNIVAVYYFMGTEQITYDNYFYATSPSAAQQAWNDNRGQAGLVVASEWCLGVLYTGQVVEAGINAPWVKDPVKQAAAPLTPALLALDLHF